MKWKCLSVVFKMIFGKKKDKKKKKEDLSKTSSNKVLIKVFKDFGSDTQYLKAQYEAVERRDIYNNLVSINEKWQHNEDIDFLMEDVYRAIETTLEFKNYDKEEKIKLLDGKIKKQETIIKYLEKFVNLNAIYNYQDENLKLRDFRILRKHIKTHDEKGSYFTIEHGVRVYSYNSMDGFLIPIWHGVDNYTQYPDHTRKLKITIQEDQRMRQELAMFNRDKKIGNILTIGIIMVIIFFAANCAIGWFLWEKHSTLDERIHDSAFKCADYTSMLNMRFAELIKNKIVDAPIQVVNETPVIEQNIKPLEPKDEITIIQ